MESIPTHTDSNVKWTFVMFKYAVSLIPVPPRGHVLCHIGANHGQEVEHYAAGGVTDLILVEPDPILARELQEKFWYASVLAVACGAGYGIATLNRSVDDQFNSLVTPGREQTGTVLVPMVPARVVQSGANILVIDTQGTEMDVLSSVDFSRVDMLIIETSGREIRNGYAPNRDILEPYLAERGYVPVQEWRHERDGSYVDLVFIKKR